MYKRQHLTSHSLENPQKPPMLCMLFRKKLTVAILRNIRQSGLDRILFFDFDAVNERGDKVNLSVCVEIMAQPVSYTHLDVYKRQSIFLEFILK